MSRKERKKVPPAEPLRSKLAVGAIAFAALASVITVWTRPAPGPDFVEVNELRFADLRPLLPARGEVGYLTDMTNDAAPYYLAQYALAPLQLSPDEKRPLVVGNFSNSSAVAAVLQRGQFEVVKDFQNGVLLLRRPAK
jgi:hypothetical protein